MAKLIGKERSQIPSSEFGIPSQRKFPLEDASHARNAKARASVVLANRGLPRFLYVHLHRTLHKTGARPA